MTKLDAKVHVATPESALIRLKFTDPADLAKIDERYNKKFLGDLSLKPGPTPNDITYKIRNETETLIRDRAVTQAKETVNKRIDEKGLREASVTTRDEDIIVEVPGEDERAFNDIKETIRRTARLEFKMVDDETDFFGKIKEDTLPEGATIFQENAPAGPGKSVPTHWVRMAKGEKETMTDCLARLKKWTATLGVPDDHQIGFSKLNDYDPDTGKSTPTGWRTYYLFGRAEVTGDYITDATVGQDNNSGAIGQFYVAVTFSPAGADRFEEVTGANIQRRFAIILDDEIELGPGHQVEDRRARQHHPRRRRPGAAALAGQGARGRAPVRRPARAHQPVQRVAHRPVARARLQSVKGSRGCSSAPASSSSSWRSTTTRAASSRTWPCSSTCSCRWVSSRAPARR